MSLKVDLNRGVLCCRDKLTGIYVYMYIDTPGVYVTETGAEVTEDLAARAGFDVERFRKERQKAEKLAAAMAVIDAENSPAPPVVLREVNGFKLMQLPHDRAEVVDAEGRKLTPSPLSTKAADAFLTTLVKVA